MPLSDLLTRLSWREIELWRAYASVEPLGAERDDFHAALIASTVVNMQRAPKTQAVRIQDFMFFSPKPKPDRKLAARKLRAQMMQLEATLKAKSNGHDR